MVAEFKGATSGNVIDATKARAHLPGLQIEIVHCGRRRASRTHLAECSRGDGEQRNQPSALNPGS